jgi:GNAT superfamily N-acetyltransferase
MARTAIRKTEVRVLGPGSIEDFHAHLVRLDRASRFPGEDDRAIDAHCLGLVSAGAILIGAFVDGVLRGGAEIVPDRTARRGEAAITVEDGYQDRGLDRELTERIVDEAQRHHLNHVRIQDQNATRFYRVPVFQLQVAASA